MSKDSIEDHKSIEDELQHCSAESEDERVEILNINDTETVYHTDSLDSFELIDYPDPDEIQIAGFNKKKLLEMSHFCKITYGNNDPRLSQLGYKTRAAFIEEGYDIIPFYYSNKTLAGFIFAKDGEITIAYRGTQYFTDVITDIYALLTPLDFLPEGGRAHYGFYSSFYDSFDNEVGSLFHVLKTHANEKKLAIKDFKFYLTGHSMGGAIAKIAALFLSKVVGAQDLHVATFADPRVFDLTASESYNKALPNRTIRVTQHRCDPVPAVAPGILGYVHVGEQLRVSVMPEYTIHKIDGYHQAIKESDFQPDNGASIFYYPVRLLILINDIVLGNSQYYAANFIRYFLYQDAPYACFSAIENTNHMSVTPISTITFNPLDHNIQLKMSMMLAVHKPDQAISIGNNASIFYFSAKILTPVNNRVLVGLFNHTSCNVDSPFSRKVGFITQDSRFSNSNKRIEAIQNLNLVEEPVKSNVIQNDDLELKSNSSQQVCNEEQQTINAYNEDGFTPLQYACLNGKLAAVKLLLKEKADPFLKNNNGETVLFDAVYLGHLEIVFILISSVENKEKYINIQNYKSETALHLIVLKQEINEKHKKAIEMLLQNGADPHLKDELGRSALDIAKKRGNKEFITLFTQSNTKKSELPIIAASTITTIEITLGIVISIYLEMLAIGIAVGVCLITSAAATFIYHSNIKNNSPKNSFETVDNVSYPKGNNVCQTPPL
ncbi:MAG: ankyrin repeat domain-containing protein [Wolbachia endosymbiont of Xenopsylla cheopis]